jgi:fused signal recognition particle receptor
VGVFTRLKESLSKTRSQLVEKVDDLVRRHPVFDEKLYDEMEEILIQADVGVGIAAELMERVRRAVKERRIGDDAGLKTVLKEQVLFLLGEDACPVNFSAEPPTVVMVAGVNGVGKTTTIGKLAYYYHSQGKKVLLGAADTFRAAAIDQLGLWAKRVGVEMISQREGADPAAVAFDSAQAACARKADLLIIDTAGRLHTKSSLMEELKKISRVLNRALPGAPHEVLLVLDASTGQNAINQARLFSEAVGITGVVLAKLDGSAKGGVILAVRKELGVSVKLIGIGEGVDDLRPFKAQEYVEALF